MGELWILNAVAWSVWIGTMVVLFGCFWTGQSSVLLHGLQICTFVVSAIVAFFVIMIYFVLEQLPSFCTRHLGPSFSYNGLNPFARAWMIGPMFAWSTALPCGFFIGWASSSSVIPGPVQPLFTIGLATSATLAIIGLVCFSYEDDSIMATTTDAELYETLVDRCHAANASLLLGTLVAGVAIVAQRPFLL